MILGPDVWGPHGWKFIHMLAMAYPNEPTVEEKQNYKNFFESLHLLLPCSLCSNNYKRHLVELPLTDTVLSNRESFVRWTIDIHNIVNKETGKKIINYNDAINLILNNYQDSTNEIKKTETIEKVKKKEYNSFFPLLALFIILVALVSIAVIYKKN